MSSTFFDAGDLDRLDREASLTEQAPRALPVDDRSPDEDNSILAMAAGEEETDDPNESLLDSLLAVLKKRL